ncbi:MAG: lipase family protein [Gammaproteobacteria bacterium]|nr:MAG: lipase family protein [Gammaproteobacteria bacterium]
MTTTPQINWSNLAPPYIDYDYFADRDKYPFSGSGAFNLTDAWWMSEISALVYFNKAKVSKIITDTKLKLIKTLYGKTAECFVFQLEKNIIIAFRGSELSGIKENRLKNIISDWATNFKFRLTPLSCDNVRIKVHRGFKTALDEIWHDLNNFIIEKQNSNLKIWFTGHSQGAALATLAAFYNGYADGVYNFGSPRVGNSEFANSFAKLPCYRLENQNDCVCHLPFFKKYWHVTQGYHLTCDSIKKTNDSKDRFDLEKIIESVKKGNNTVPSLLSDHIPINYSYKIKKLITKNS